MSISQKKSFKLKLLDARKKITNPKRGGKDSFKKRNYVTLQDLYDEVIPALLEESLLLINKKEFIDGNTFLKTQILDVDSDDFIETSALLNSDLKIQEQGSELTYHSRYNLGCLLSVRTDFDGDDDGESIKNIAINKKLIGKKEIKYPSPKEITELVTILSYIPSYRKEIENILIKDGISCFENMPYQLYKNILKSSKEKAKNKLKKEVESSNEDGQFYAENYFENEVTQ